MRSTWAQASANSVALSLVEAACEGGEDRGLGVVAHGDDEGKADVWRHRRRSVGEAGALGVGQRVEAGARPVRRSMSAVSRLAAASLPARSGWARQHRHRARSAEAARNTRASAFCKPVGAVMGRAELQQPGAVGDPGRMFEDAADRRATNSLAVISDGQHALVRRVGRGPVPGDVDAAREPDAARGSAHGRGTASARRSCPDGRSAGCAGRSTSSSARLPRPRHTARRRRRSGIRRTARPVM